MTVEEAFAIIEEMTPCASCQYRNTGCKRKDKHVWCDGFCHQVDEALEVLMEALGITPDEPEPEPTPEPEPEEPEEPEPEEPEPEPEENEEP